MFKKINQTVLLQKKNVRLQTFETEFAKCDINIDLSRRSLSFKFQTSLLKVKY